MEEFEGGRVVDCAGADEGGVYAWGDGLREIKALEVGREGEEAC